MGKAKIACCMTTVGYSGAPKMMAWIANQIAENGYNVDLVTYYHNNDIQPIHKTIKRFDFNIKRKSTNIIGKIIETLLAYKKLCNYAKKEKPDLIIMFSNLASFLYLLFRIDRKIPVIISERGDPDKGGLIYRILRKSYNLANRIVFQTEEAKDKFPDKIKNKSVVIPNPVMLAYRKCVEYSKRDNTIAFVARFNIEQKRQDIMVEAFEIVHKKHPTIKLNFFGDGPDMKKIMDMVEEKNLSQYVEFYGFVSPIEQYIRNSAVFVLTSDFEGIPNALIDAMALGIPVVSTDCSPGGAKLLIDNYKNGILVPKSDSKKVAEAINYLLENPQEADKMGTKAQEIIDKFSPVRIYSLWQKEIRCILNNDKDK
jgi:GalNAc-alpha-(1->4)-GalNAc-alpha-(1->3)-diNAcBac-PP-undecaprenol alpha-1,4-N-acetyl-D-galactosaminyltransferase